MRDIMDRAALDRVVSGNWAWWGPEETVEFHAVMRHDDALRARIAELEMKLAEYEHIGTGAGVEVRRDY